MTRSLSAPAALLALLIWPAAAFSQNSPDDVLVENAFIKLTRADYEADLQRVPADRRAAFAADPKRLTAFLNNLLITKTLAAEARKQGIDREPTAQRRIELEAERVLAELQLQRVEEAAAAEFRDKSAQFLLKAREIYALEKDKYRVAEQVSASHILFEAEKRGAEAALELARQARAKLVAGADFTALAKELSEDPSAKNNGGQLGWFGAGVMDPAFTKAAFELKQVGDISEPVLSRFGYHIIRLDGRRAAGQLAFDDVKSQIMADLRKRYIEDQRQAKIEAIRADPNMKVNQQAVDSLVFRLPQRLMPRLPEAPSAK